MPEEPDRLEREINEILNKIEQFPTPERRRARAARKSLRRFGDAVSSRQRTIARELSRISLSQLVLLSFLLILGSFVLRGIGPVGTWIMVAGVVLLVASLALMLFAGLIVFWVVSDVMSRAPRLMLDNAVYIKRVRFPLEILPWVVLCGALFHAALVSLVRGRRVAGEAVQDVQVGNGELLFVIHRQRRARDERQKRRAAEQSSPISDPHSRSSQCVALLRIRPRHKGESVLPTDAPRE